MNALPSEPAHTSPSAVRSLAALSGWLLLTFSASATAVFVSTGGWYAGLAKPTWNPPGWVFGPVWTALYALMAVAAWRVWRHGGWAKQTDALGLFVFQWALKALETPLFFDLRPGTGLGAGGACWRPFWRPCGLSGGQTSLLASYCSPIPRGSPLPRYSTGRSGC